MAGFLTIIQPWVRRASYFLKKKKQQKTPHENEKNRSGSSQDLPHSQFDNICIQKFHLLVLVPGNNKAMNSN